MGGGWTVAAEERRVQDGRRESAGDEHTGSPAIAVLLVTFTFREIPALMAATNGFLSHRQLVVSLLRL